MGGAYACVWETRDQPVCMRSARTETCTFITTALPGKPFQHTIFISYHHTSNFTHPPIHFALTSRYLIVTHRTQVSFIELPFAFLSVSMASSVQTNSRTRGELKVSPYGEDDLVRLYAHKLLPTPPPPTLSLHPTALVLTVPGSAAHYRRTTHPACRSPTWSRSLRSLSGTEGPPTTRTSRESCDGRSSGIS